MMTEKEKKFLSLFANRYLFILNECLKKDYDILDTQILKILEFKKDISARIISECWNENDKITKSCKKLFDQLYDQKEIYYRGVDMSKLDSKILNYFNIQEKPELILYEKIEKNPARKYVLAFLIDYNEDDYGRPRNGNGERFYGSGQARTKEEFLSELKATYKDCHWTEVQGCSEVYEDPAATQYYYNGYIYTHYDDTKNKKGGK